MTGPKVNPELLSILLKFRQHEVAFMADILANKWKRMMSELMNFIQNEVDSWERTAKMAKKGKEREKITRGPRKCAQNDKLWQHLPCMLQI